MVMTSLSPFIEAIRSNDLSRVERYLTEKPALLTTELDADGYHAIHIATESNCLQLIKFFLNKDPSLVDQKARFGITPIMIAVRNMLPPRPKESSWWVGSAETNADIPHLIICHLIDHRATLNLSIDRPDGPFNGWTVLQLATDCPTRNRLIEAGAQDSIDQEGLYLIHKAVSHKQQSTVEALLIKQPELIHQKTSSGKTPLGIAIEFASRSNDKDQELITFLIQKGANTHEEINNRSLLELIYSKLGSAFITSLINHIDRIDEKDYELYIKVALDWPSNVDYLSALLNRVPKLSNYTDTSGQSLLMRYAQTKGCTPKAIAFLIEKDADQSQFYPDMHSSHYGYTAIYFAVWSDQIFSQFALHPFLDSTHRVANGKHLIHVIAKHGCVDTLQRLLKAKPDLLNLKDDSLATPLYYATEGNKLDCIRYLIKMEAALDCRVSAPLDTDHGFTALDKARQQGFTDAVQLLLDSGARLHTLRGNPAIKQETALTNQSQDNVESEKKSTQMKTLCSSNDPKKSFSLKLEKLPVDEGDFTWTTQFQMDDAMNSQDEKPIDRSKVDKLTHVGAGFTGVLAVLMAHLEYRLRGEPLRITLIGDQHPTESPASNLSLSLSAQEGVAVMPSPAEARQYLELLWTEPGGLAASTEHLQTPKARAFIAELYNLANNPQKIENDKKLIEKYGQFCMLLWERIVELAQELQDEELLDILGNKSSLRLPARPGANDNGENHRVDIYINTPNALSKTGPLVDAMQRAGYTDAKILSPEEYPKYIPDGQAFAKHAQRDDVSVARRPGGRIIAHQFMKHIMPYLEKSCGHYLNEKGKRRAYFRFHQRTVTGLVCDPDTDLTAPSTNIVDLTMADPKTSQPIITNRKDTQYRNYFYMVNTGSRAGAAESLGIEVPLSALLAGTFMKIRVPKDPLSPSVQTTTHLGLRHGNPVNGIETSVAQIYTDPTEPEQRIMRAAGLKIFCGHTEPARQGTLDPFAYRCLLLQFTMLQTIFPNLLKPVLDLLTGPPTKADLLSLQEKGIIDMGVECRDVSTTNITYVSKARLNNGKVAENVAICASPSSSGGSYGPGNIYFMFKHLNIPSPRFQKTEDQMKETADAAYVRMAELN